MLFFTDK